MCWCQCADVLMLIKTPVAGDIVSGTEQEGIPDTRAHIANTHKHTQGHESWSFIDMNCQWCGCALPGSELMAHCGGGQEAVLGIYSLWSASQREQIEMRITTRCAISVQCTVSQICH